MSDPLTRRSLTPEIRVINKDEGLVDYVASDESLDSYREVIQAKGWRFSRFSRNAPFVDSHDYWSIDKLLGSVISFRVEGGQLIERVKWAIDVPESQNPLPRLGFSLTLGGHLKAVSVGFMPVRWADQGSDDFAKACGEMKLSPEVIAKTRRIYLEHEQIELSACIIGANPNALAKAFSDGVVTEEQMARLGFVSEVEMEFLQRGAAAWEQLDELHRGMVRTELGRIFRARNISGNGNPKANSPSTPGGGDAATRQAEERRRNFLADLDACTKRLATA
jgi:hypothetical protein